MQKEAILQKTCCHYLDVCCPEVVYWHNANAQILSGIVRDLFIKSLGPKPGALSAARVIGTIVNFLRSLGLKPGVPDLTLHWTLGFGAGTAYVEFKTPSGTISKEQKLLHARLKALSIKVHIVRSYEEFIELVQRLKMPCRDHFAAQKPAAENESPP